LGLIEFYRLFAHTKYSNLHWELSTSIGVLFAAFVIAIIYNHLPDWSIVMLVPLLFLSLLGELWRKSAHPIVNGAITILGIIYIVLPFVLLIYINHFDRNQFPLLAGMFLLIWSNDTFAYLTGRLIGRTKLFERISPKKTWEGTIGGAIITVIIAYLIGAFLDTGNLTYWLINSAFVIPGAIFGDLLESLFKRSLNIKDTGSILPGHGGILDRFDAMIFVVPFFLAWTFIYMYI
jgi:phosphatidate cytidylyltransferase